MTGHLGQRFDVVILVAKVYVLEQTLIDRSPAIGPDTLIARLLNGMRHVDLLTGLYGEAPVLAGVCVVATMPGP